MAFSYLNIKLRKRDYFGYPKETLLWNVLEKTMYGLKMAYILWVVFGIRIVGKRLLYGNNGVKAFFIMIIIGIAMALLYVGVSIWQAFLTKKTEDALQSRLESDYAFAVDYVRHNPDQRTWVECLNMEFSLIGETDVPLEKMVPDKNRKSPDEEEAEKVYMEIAKEQKEQRRKCLSIILMVATVIVCFFVAFLKVRMELN